MMESVPSPRQTSRPPRRRHLSESAIDRIAARIWPSYAAARPQECHELVEAVLEGRRCAATSSERERIRDLASIIEETTP